MSCIVDDMGRVLYIRIDLEPYGRCVVTLSGALNLSHTVIYYRPSRPLPPSDSPETAHALCRASYMIWDAYSYIRIDLEPYGRCVVTISGALNLCHAVKYYRPSRPLPPSSNPETTHALCRASYMIWDAYSYIRIDLEPYGGCVVTLSGALNLCHTV
jgi:hypothetical protein